MFKIDSFSIHGHIQTQVTHPRAIHWVRGIQYQKYCFKCYYRLQAIRKKYRLLDKNLNLTLTRRCISIEQLSSSHTCFDSIHVKREHVFSGSNNYLH